MGAIGGHSLPDFVVNDLSSSDLTPEDVNARILGSAECATTGASPGSEGYVLPYFDMHGHLRPFYRVRLINGSTQFKQPRDAPNHVYFPKGFHASLALNMLRHNTYVLITEGEKAATAATNKGFPCVGLASPEAWRNRTLLVSGDAALSHYKSKLAIKLPSNDDADESTTLSSLATGLPELIDLAVQKGLTFIITYDTNNVTGEVDVDDQRSAASLGFELRFRGIPFHRVRQLVLPSSQALDSTASRTNLGMYLMTRGAQDLEALLVENLKAPSAFPQHPNLRAYVNDRLARGRLSRKELQDISLSVLSDLDSHGKRLRALDGQTYYFDNGSRELLLSRWPNGPDEQYQGAFTQYLYRRYGLAPASSDKQLLVWLGTQFTGEDPIQEVVPQRVVAYDIQEAAQDRVLYQLSDTQYIEVTANDFKVHNNGDQGVLFQNDQVEPLNTDLLLRELAQQQQVPVTCWWAATLAQVRLRDKDKQRIVAALLYYLSPWLFRWRGMQLPVELVVGESGSGKSTLCELRLGILTGRPYLRNTPSDIKDWYASILNTGGLHVTDNVQFADKQLRQRISDEVCRIITEPDPFVEQRKYYTNAELVRIPVRAIFAITAIQQPFVNPDILQRSFLLELDKSIELLKSTPSPRAWAEDPHQEGQTIIGGIRYDSSWKAKQLQQRGGREGWIAHHLVVLQRFFQSVATNWDNNYQAKHRLINFEQSLMLLGGVFGMPTNWIPNWLTTASDHAVTDTDWVLSGLHEFSLEHNVPVLRTKKFYTSTISDWGSEQDEFKNCDLLVNPHKLAKYIKAHKSTVFQLTGILEVGKESNKTFYQFRGQPLPRRES